MNDTTLPTPQEVEAQLLQKQAQRVEDPVEMAAKIYAQGIEIFKAGIDKLQSRATKRVLKALVEYPLNVKEYKPQSKFEGELMQTGLNLLEAKFVMTLSTYNQELEKLVDAANAQIPLTDEEKVKLGFTKEQNNGNVETTGENNG